MLVLFTLCNVTKQGSFYASVILQHIYEQHSLSLAGQGLTSHTPHWSLCFGAVFPLAASFSSSAFTVGPGVGGEASLFSFLVSSL